MANGIEKGPSLGSEHRLSVAMRELWDLLLRTEELASEVLQHKLNVLRRNQHSVKQYVRCLQCCPEEQTLRQVRAERCGLIQLTIDVNVQQ